MSKTANKSYKRLIRNLRKKKDEKYTVPKDNDTFLFGKESKNNKSGL